TPSSPPTFFDRRSDLLVRERSFPSCAGADSCLELPQLRNGSSDRAELPTFRWNHPGNGLVVPGHDDFLASRHAIEKLAEPGLRLQCGHGDHRLLRVASDWLFFNS